MVCSRAAHGFASLTKACPVGSQLVLQAFGAICGTAHEMHDRLHWFSVHFTLDHAVASSVAAPARDFFARHRLDRQRVAVLGMHVGAMCRFELADLAHMNKTSAGMHGHVQVMW